MQALHPSPSIQAPVNSAPKVTHRKDFDELYGLLFSAPPISPQATPEVQPQPQVQIAPQASLTNQTAKALPPNLVVQPEQAASSSVGFTSALSANANASPAQTSLPSKISAPIAWLKATQSRIQSFFTRPRLVAAGGIFAVVLATILLPGGNKQPEKPQSSPVLASSKNQPLSLDPPKTAIQTADRSKPGPADYVSAEKSPIENGLDGLNEEGPDFLPDFTAADLNKLDEELAALASAEAEVSLTGAFQPNPAEFEPQPAEKTDEPTPVLAQTKPEIVFVTPDEVTNDVEPMDYPQLVSADMDSVTIHYPEPMEVGSPENPVTMLPSELENPAQELSERIGVPSAASLEDTPGGPVAKGEAAISWSRLIRTEADVIGAPRVNMRQLVVSEYRDLMKLEALVESEWIAFEDGSTKYVTASANRLEKISSQLAEFDKLAAEIAVDYSLTIRSFPLVGELHEANRSVQERRMKLIETELSEAGVPAEKIHTEFLKHVPPDLDGRRGVFLRLNWAPHVVDSE